MTLDELRSNFVYEPDTGRLTRKVAVHYKAPAGADAGSVNSDGYLQVTHKGVKYKVHRLVWLMQKGHWPAKDVDHMNGRRADNRWSNLREATRQENSQNTQSARRNSKTGVLGVSYLPRLNKYAARIYVEKKLRRLGCFTTAEDAHMAYVQAKRKLHKGNTL